MLTISDILAEVVVFVLDDKVEDAAPVAAWLRQEASYLRTEAEDPQRK